MENPKKEQGINKESELLKVQLIADFLHNSFNIFMAAITAIGIGLAAVLYAVWITTGNQSFIYAFAAIIFIYIVYVYMYTKTYHERFDSLDSLIKRIEKGESIPSLIELRKQYQILSKQEK